MAIGGAYGHAVGKSIAPACLSADLAVPDSVPEAAVLGTRIPVMVTQAPIYDPKNRRPRA